MNSDQSCAFCKWGNGIKQAFLGSKTYWIIDKKCKRLNVVVYFILTLYIVKLENGIKPAFSGSKSYWVVDKKCQT